MIKKILNLAVFIATLSPVCHAQVSIDDYETQDFNPTKGETFVIPVIAEQAGDINVQIYTSDRDLVTTLNNGVKTQTGAYQFAWDGKDSSGTVVPDEAYIPVVKFVSGASPSDSFEYDPRASSGGEEIQINPNVSQRGQIVFQLDKPARVLARAGIKSGPMLNSIAHWQVRNKGRNILRWDGFDEDGLVNLYSHEKLAVLVTGFELPQHAIITRGNGTLAYPDWRANNQWSSEMPDLSKVSFQRDNRRVSRNYHLPRSVDITPRVNLEIVGDTSGAQAKIPIVSGPVSLRVTMDQEDRWAMQQSRYEVAFFINNEFVSEEEQGYVPLTWRWNPAGIAPGKHIVTVNVSGFNGQVGVKSIEIEIPQ